MKYKMCCHVDQNCPELLILKSKVIIKDDDGNRVEMNKEQFRKLLNTDYGVDLNEV